MQPRAIEAGKSFMQVARFGPFGRRPPWLKPWRAFFALRKMVGVTGVEPVTLRLSSACSNQLSYTPNIVGGAEETRTPDL